MKKNYFLIAGMLLLLIVGGYFGIQKFSGNSDEVIIEDVELNPNNPNKLSNSSDKKILRL